MGTTAEELRSNDPQLYDALVLLSERLNINRLNQDIANTVITDSTSTTQSKLTVKDLCNILDPNQRVKIKYEYKVVYKGLAISLSGSEYKDCFVKNISSSIIEPIFLYIVLDNMPDLIEVVSKGE